MRTRRISTTAHITLEQGDTESLVVSRELVMDEDRDGTWLVYAVVPESVDDAGERMVSGSIRVTDEAGKQLLGNLFTLLAGPGVFGSAPTRTQ